MEKNSEKKNLLLKNTFFIEQLSNYYKFYFIKEKCYSIKERNVFKYN